MADKYWCDRCQVYTEQDAGLAVVCFNCGKLLVEARAADTVNHPPHYGGDTVYETIKVIRAWKLNFSLGNAVKYISRAGKKDPAKTIEDLEKARFYLDEEIRARKSEHASTEHGQAKE